MLKLIFKNCVIFHNRVSGGSDSYFSDIT